jgi:hypothetical protein
MNTQFPVGTHLDGFVSNTTDATDPFYIEDRDLVVTPVLGVLNLKANDPMYFPVDKSPVNIFVLHPNNILSYTWDGGMIDDWDVPSDFTSEGGYASADLIYASKLNVPDDATLPVALQFYHLMSKIRVAVAPGTGLTVDDLEGATLQILNVYGYADVTLNITTEITGVADAATVTPAGNQNSNALLTCNISPDLNSPVWNDGILVPQTIPAGTEFIRITLNDAVNTQLKYLMPSEYTIEGGKQYIWKITAVGTALTLSSNSISDWGWTNDNSGNAE